MLGSADRTGSMLIAKYAFPIFPIYETDASAASRTPRGFLVKQFAIRWSELNPVGQPEGV